MKKFGLKYIEMLLFFDIYMHSLRKYKKKAFNNGNTKIKYKSRSIFLKIIACHNIKKSTKSLKVDCMETL